MKTKTKLFFFTVCFFVYGFSVNAQEVIKFTWNVVKSQSFEILASHEKKYTIDWGDGTPIDTIIDEHYYTTHAHTYAVPGEYQVIISAVDEDCVFPYLDCSGSQITSLDLTKNPTLSRLICCSNPLTTLDLSSNHKIIQLSFYRSQLVNLILSKNLCPMWMATIECTYNQLINLSMGDNAEINCSNNKLAHLNASDSYENLILDCSNNQFLLSKLNAICQMIVNPKGRIFGTQNLEASNAETIDFSSEVKFNGVATVFEVQKDSLSAIINIDYSINKGVITFKKNGNYVITMTNSEILPPAKVIAEFNVNIEGIVDLTISANFIVYPNPTTNCVYIKSEKETVSPELKLYSMEGKELYHNSGTEINMANYPTGIYFLKIKDTHENIYTTKIIKM